MSQDRKREREMDWTATGDSKHLVPDHEAVAELVAEVAQMGQALDGLVADQRRHAADLHRRLNSARESQAQLEEENALLLWLHAEAEWKLELESAKSWAREQAGKPYEGWNVLRRRRVEQHSVWVMGACTCGAKCDGAAGWKQHQYEVGAWVPQKGERVTGKSRGKYDPDPVGEFDSFSYEGTTAIIRHVPPRHPGVVVDRTYVDAHTLRPVGTEGATSKAEPDKWEPTLGERVKGAVAGSDRWVTGPYHGGFWSMFEGRAMARVGDEGDPGLAADWMVFADSLRPAPTEPEVCGLTISGRWCTLPKDHDGFHNFSAEQAAPTEPRVWHKGDPEPEFVASVRDTDGDVWTRDHRGVWRTPDHGPCGWGYVANRWGPLTEVVEHDPAVVDLSLTRTQELERDAADMETHGGELE